jgi:hypothetical protein
MAEQFQSDPAAAHILGRMYADTGDSKSHYFGAIATFKGWNKFGSELPTPDRIDITFDYNGTHYDISQSLNPNGSPKSYVMLTTPEGRPIQRTTGEGYPAQTVADTMVGDIVKKALERFSAGKAKLYGELHPNLVNTPDALKALPALINRPALPSRNNLPSGTVESSKDINLKFSPTGDREWAARTPFGKLTVGGVENGQFNQMNLAVPEGTKNSEGREIPAGTYTIFSREPTPGRSYFQAKGMSNRHASDGALPQEVADIFKAAKNSPDLGIMPYKPKIERLPAAPAQ